MRAKRPWHHIVELNQSHGVALCAAIGVVLTGCYLDELTAPPADESSIEFNVSGDSVVLLLSRSGHNGRHGWRSDVDRTDRAV